MLLEEDQMIHIQFPTNDGPEVEIIRREMKSPQASLFTGPTATVISYILR
jgi:hypothetical protein